MSAPEDRQEAFVKVSVNAPDHYKLRRLATMLGVSKNEAFGAWVRLLCWLPENGSMGILDLSAEELAVVMELDALAPEDVVSALLEVRLLECSDNGSLLVHDWTEEPHTGAFYLQRSVAGSAGAHKRWHEDRGIVEPNCRLCQSGVDGILPSQNGIADQDQDQDQDVDQEVSTASPIGEGKQGSEEEATPTIDWPLNKWKKHRPEEYELARETAEDRGGGGGLILHILREDYLPEMLAEIEGEMVQAAGDHPCPMCGWATAVGEFGGFHRHCRPVICCGEAMTMREQIFDDVHKDHWFTREIINSPDQSQIAEIREREFTRRRLEEDRARAVCCHCHSREHTPSCPVLLGSEEECWEADPAFHMDEDLGEAPF